MIGFYETNEDQVIINTEMGETVDEAILKIAPRISCVRLVLLLC
jgi:hypothetical protein